MPAPIATILNVSKSKLSHQSGANQITISFKFDVDIQAYTINILGTAPTTGTVAGSQYKSISELAKKKVSEVNLLTIKQIRQIDASTNISDIVDDTEIGISATDGDYRINIYGQALDGTWTPYNQA